MAVYNDAFLGAFCGAPLRHRGWRAGADALQAPRTRPGRATRHVQASYRHQETGVEKPRLPQDARRRAAAEPVRAVGGHPYTRPAPGRAAPTAHGAEGNHFFLARQSSLETRAAPTRSPGTSTSPEAKQLRGRAGCVKAAAAGGSAAFAWRAPFAFFRRHRGTACARRARRCPMLPRKSDGRRGTARRARGAVFASPPPAVSLPTPAVARLAETSRPRTLRTHDA